MTSPAFKLRFLGRQQVGRLGEGGLGDKNPGVLPAPHETLGAVPVAAAYLLTLAVLGLDMIVSPGTGICFLYLVPLAFLAMWSSPKQVSPILIMASLCAILTWVVLFLSPDPVWVAVVNRLITVIVIGITVMLSLMRKRAEEDVKVLHGLLPICSYCKKIRDDRGYWEQVERYIGARSNADFSHGMCPDCGPKHFPGLYSDHAVEHRSKGDPLGFFSRQEF